MKTSRLNIFILLIALFSFIPSSKAMKPTFIGETTSDPRAYVLAHADSPGKGVAQFDCKSCSFMKDLVFVAATEECGSAGCLFYVFKSSDKAYRYFTNIFLSPGAFQFLKTQHNGWNDILLFQRLSESKGILVTDQFDGKRYKGVGTNKTISGLEVSKYMKPEMAQLTYYTQDLRKLAH